MVLPPEIVELQTHSSKRARASMFEIITAFHLPVLSHMKMISEKSLISLRTRCFQSDGQILKNKQVSLKDIHLSCRET